MGAKPVVAPVDELSAVEAQLTKVEAVAQRAVSKQISLKRFMWRKSGGWWERD
ncbi:MAG: hypothetical protein R3F31_00035 [Verrucomicrobiales bacterium]